MANPRAAPNRISAMDHSWSAYVGSQQPQPSQFTAPSLIDVAQAPGHDRGGAAGCKVWVHIFDGVDGPGRGDAQPGARGEVRTDRLPIATDRFGDVAHPYFAASGFKEVPGGGHICRAFGL